MLEFAFQPEVYATSSDNSLLKMLETIWIKKHVPGNGTLYLISGYANYNGGVRFYSTFTNHVRNGGKVTAILSASSTQRLSSVQVAEELLKCGVGVYIVNRKRLLHAKCYGVMEPNGNQQLIVTSGNFTGPGMSENGEAALKVDNENLKNMSFSWKELMDNIFRQKWDIYQLEIEDVSLKSNPAWKLLYDETKPAAMFDESNQVSMLISLNHSDTVSIQALPGSSEGFTSQYFGLGHDALAFFPAFNGVRPVAGRELYSCFIHVNFIDLNTRRDCLVTFETGNNLDFRLGTGILRFTKIAYDRDLALLSRVGEYNYELRIFREGSPLYRAFLPYADRFNHIKNNYYGYIPNNEVKKILFN